MSSIEVTQLRQLQQHMRRLCRPIQIIQSHSQRGQRSKRANSALCLSWVKSGLFKRQIFFPLKHWSINGLSSIMWINKEYPTSLVSEDSLCLQREERRPVFVIHPAPLKLVPASPGQQCKCTTNTHTQAYTNPCENKVIYFSQCRSSVGCSSACLSGL